MNVEIHGDFHAVPQILSFFLRRDYFAFSFCDLILTRLFCTDPHSFWKPMNVEVCGQFRAVHQIPGKPLIWGWDRFRRSTSSGVEALLLLRTYTYILSPRSLSRSRLITH